MANFLKKKKAMQSSELINASQNYIAKMRSCLTTPPTVTMPNLSLITSIPLKKQAYRAQLLVQRYKKVSIQQAMSQEK